MGAALSCCRHPEDAQASDAATETPKAGRRLSDVDADGDMELARVLEGLRVSARLHEEGRCGLAAEYFDEARGLMEQMEESPAPGIKRSESLRKIRVIFEEDPTLRELEAGRTTSPCLMEGAGPQKDAAPPEVGLAPGHDPEANAEALHERFDRLVVLCSEARVFEAAAALQELRDEADAALRRARERQAQRQQSTGDGAGRATPASALVGLSARLREEPALAALRETHERMRQLLSKIGPGALPAGAQDARWVHAAIRDPVVGKSSPCEIHLRFMDAHERDKGGPSTQLILCGQLNNFPLRLDRFVAVYRETDLYRKEWIADAEKCEGGTSGPERSYSSYSRIVNASAMLPVRLEVLTVREFAVCADAPLAGRRAGVLISDMSPPSDAKEFCGWPLPAHPKKTIRLSNFGTLLYFVPSEANPACCDVFAFCLSGVPLPQWMIPLTLIKKFLVNHFLSVFRAIKTNIVDRWDELGYGARIAACQDFYGPIAELGRSRSP